MTELLSILYKLRIFTLDELSEALKGKVKSVEALLARYKQQGWIVAIRRNTYCMKDIASGLPVCDKYEIGSHLSLTACISYHTALEFHGLAHQPFNEVFVKSMTRFNPFSFRRCGLYLLPTNKGNRWYDDSQGKPLCTSNGYGEYVVGLL